MESNEEFQLMKRKVHFLLELLKYNSKNENDVINVKYQLNELSQNLLSLLENQYKVIKSVALGDYDEFKKEIETLFAMNELLVSIMFVVDE